MYNYVTKYKPEYIWSDGDWVAPPEYWTSQQWLAWLYNDRFVWGLSHIMPLFSSSTCENKKREVIEVFQRLYKGRPVAWNRLKINELLFFEMCLFYHAQVNN